MQFFLEKEIRILRKREIFVKIFAFHEIFDANIVIMQIFQDFVDIFETFLNSQTLPQFVPTRSLPKGISIHL